MKLSGSRVSLIVGWRPVGANSGFGGNGRRITKPPLSLLPFPPPPLRKKCAGRMRHTQSPKGWRKKRTRLKGAGIHTHFPPPRPFLSACDTSTPSAFHIIPCLSRHNAVRSPNPFPGSHGPQHQICVQLDDGSYTGESTAQHKQGPRAASHLRLTKRDIAQPALSPPARKASNIRELPTIYYTHASMQRAATETHRLRSTKQRPNHFGRIRISAAETAREGRATDLVA